MTCPYCREAFGAEEGRLACARCRTNVHGECAALHEGCVVYGCDGQTFLPGEQAPDRQRLPAIPGRLRLGRLLATALDDCSLLAIGALGVTALLIQSIAG